MGSLRSFSLAPLTVVRHGWRILWLGVALFAATSSAVADQEESVAPEPARPIQVEASCASDCTARGYDGEYCARVCELPATPPAPPTPPVDYRCVTACRDGGGDARDCRQRCFTR